jgi:hypothetical protein
MPRSRKKIVEDAVRVRAADLHLLPRAVHQDVLVDGPQPVLFHWSTDHRHGTVRLRCGRSSGNFQVECRPNNFGPVWWFKVDGRLVRSVYCVMDPSTGRGEWGSKDQLELEYACRAMGRRNRLRRERERLVRAKVELEEDRKVARWKQITERLEHIKEELV